MNMIKNLLIRYYKILTIILFVFITALSLFPLPELPEVPGKDKTLHMLAYAVLAFPVSFARPKYIGWILLALLIWSGIIELIQPYVNRYGEFADLIANGAGLLLGYLAARLLAYLLPERSKNTKL